MSGESVLAWAVKARDGAIDLCTLKDTKRESIDAFEWKEEMPFSAARKEFGYRVVRVRVTEVRDGGE